MLICMGYHTEYASQGRIVSIENIIFILLFNIPGKISDSHSKKNIASDEAFITLKGGSVMIFLLRVS